MRSRRADDCQNARSHQFHSPKLGLPASGEDHRRVLAVLAYVSGER